MGVMASPLTGPAGNVEFLLYALAATAPGETTLETLVDQTLADLPTGPEH